MKYLLCFLLLLNMIQYLYCQKTKSIPPEKPKLVVVIVVDQMRYDYIERYWQKFEKNGFKRLINEGTFCKNTQLNYLFTQTGPGHATIFTGTTPSIHGIVSNEWYLRLGEKRVYCVSDENVKTVGGVANNGNYSPKYLEVTTIGDEIKLSNKGKSKVVGISLKDRAAVLPAGHLANAAYWFDDYTGRFISSTFYMDSLPAWVREFNGKKYSDLYLEREWATLLPIEQYTESLSDSCSFETGLADRKTTFPYNLMEISKKGKNEKDYSFIRSVPYGNTLLKDFSLQAIFSEELGQDEYTDFLSVSFSCTDYIGHDYGPLSVEIEDTYLRLDRDIAHFLNYIDS
ncbi:MAG: alkaline phosphatase family protein, partial [Bacteroidota bacterium]